MTIQAEVTTMLATLNAGFPDVTSVPPSELRTLIRNRRAPLTGLPDMLSVENHVIDGPGGDLAIRVFRPHGTSNDVPLVVFAHGAVSCSAIWTVTTNSVDRWRRESAQ